jgi:hypothetical protein
MPSLLQPTLVAARSPLSLVSRRRRSAEGRLACTGCASSRPPSDERLCGFQDAFVGGPPPLGLGAPAEDRLATIKASMRPLLAGLALSRS